MAAATDCKKLGKEPPARAYHGAAASANNRMCVWGGDGRNVPTALMERFDVSSATWEAPPVELRDSLGFQCLPDGLQRMAVASSPSGKMYTFGGQISDDIINVKYINDVYEIDLATTVCRRLVPASPLPSPRSGSAMVWFEGRLVVYGGWKGQNLFSEDLHVFDLGKSEWASH